MTEPNQPDPQLWQEALRWLVYADEDIRLVEFLAERSDFVAAAGLHCQQAAEKMAKAVLVSLGSDYPKIHDIAELARRFEVRFPEIAFAVMELAGLTDWYFMARYPGDEEFAPSLRDIAVVLGKLKSLRRMIAGLAPPAE